MDRFFCQPVWSKTQESPNHFSTRNLYWWYSYRLTTKRCLMTVAFHKRPAIRYDLQGPVFNQLFCLYQLLDLGVCHFLGSLSLGSSSSFENLFWSWHIPPVLGQLVYKQFLYTRTAVCLGSHPTIELFVTTKNMSVEKMSKLAFLIQIKGNTCTENPIGPCTSTHYCLVHRSVEFFVHVFPLIC